MGGLTAILRSPNEAPPLIHVSPPLGTLHMVDQRRCCLLTAPTAKNRTASGLNHQPSVNQRWRFGAYPDPTAGRPLVNHRSPDGGPTKQSGPPLEICRNIVATVPTVEPGSFQRSCDPTVKPPDPPVIALQPRNDSTNHDVIGSLWMRVCARRLHKSAAAPFLVDRLPEAINTLESSKW
ncbi:hypothetical protein PCANC_12202 [Puccinia coronata f. sp. avenae]|uniref:Uncharacterized protein n=1 Tax=Puccinia coronata f. sp. avenae TaxID=200324 RepID=A0A2N5VEW7_9BASI|nr:hypothetical protein PCANC_12202 [Puccinia coronata f. sp. avenae]